MNVCLILNKKWEYINIEFFVKMDIWEDDDDGDDISHQYFNADGSKAREQQEMLVFFDVKKIFVHVWMKHLLYLFNCVGIGKISRE